MLSRWWPAILWMAVIFATSCTVITSQQWTKTVVTRGPVHMSEHQFQGFWDTWWWLFVKGYHSLEYAILSIFLLRAFKGRTLFVALFAVAYAASDEYHQTFVKYRGGRWTDVAIDSIGIGLVCLAALAVQAKAAGWNHVENL